VNLIVVDICLADEDNNSVYAVTDTGKIYTFNYQRDTLVTIQPATPGCSSATGGSVSQTLGNLVSPDGGRVKVSPTADIDIYTPSNETNRLVGVSGQTFFTFIFPGRDGRTGRDSDAHIPLKCVPQTFKLVGCSRKNHTSFINASRYRSTDQCIDRWIDNDRLSHGLITHLPHQLQTHFI